MVLSLVDGLPQTEAVHDAISWGQDQRPHWWFSGEVIWSFQIPNGQAFASSNLDAVVNRLAIETRRTIASVRRELFLTAPLEPTPTPLTLTCGTTVRCHHLHPYVRQQVVRLKRLERLVSNLQREVYGEVVRIGAAAVEGEPHEALRLIDPTDTDFYLGLGRKEFLEVARENRGYTIEQFFADLPADTTSPTGDQPRPAQARDKFTPYEQQEVERIVAYFDLPDFTPRNEHEMKAMSLHRYMRAADSAREEDQRMLERNRYIVRHVIK